MYVKVQGGSKNILKGILVFFFSLFPLFIRLSPIVVVGVVVIAHSLAASPVPKTVKLGKMVVQKEGSKGLQGTSLFFPFLLSPPTPLLARAAFEKQKGARGR